MLRITNVKIIRRKESTNRVRAIATITIDDCFVVHNIKILEDISGKLFIAMPSQRTPDGGFKDIAHPINQETRKKIQEAILLEYSK